MCVYYVDDEEVAVVPVEALPPIVFSISVNIFVIPCFHFVVKFATWGVPSWLQLLSSSTTDCRLRLPPSSKVTEKNVKKMHSKSIVEISVFTEISISNSGIVMIVDINNKV